MYVKRTHGERVHLGRRFNSLGRGARPIAVVLCHPDGPLDPGCARGIPARVR